jgi:hypothetical protein
MPKKKPVTDDEHVLAALHTAKQEGAKAMLVEIGSTITSITIFLDDRYRDLLNNDETVKYEFEARTGRLKKLDAPH